MTPESAHISDRRITAAEAEPSLGNVFKNNTASFTAQAEDEAETETNRYQMTPNIDDEEDPLALVELTKQTLQF